MINENFLKEIEKILPQEEINEFVENCRIPLKKSIKINLHKISPEKFREITENFGRKLSNHGFIEEKNNKLPIDTFYIDREDTSTPLGNTFLHKSGFFYVQEIAAGLTSRFLELNEDSLVLDISASPGGKSTQIGDYMLYLNPKKPGFLISNDIKKKKITTLAHNLNRNGIYNSGITKINGFSFGKNLGEIFDEVLVDAPCSGEGTGFKSDFSLKYRRKEEINKIAGTQFQLLISAIKATKPGGSIVFSTCTINPYENEKNIKRIQEFFGDMIEIEDVEIKDKSLGIKETEEEKFLSEEKSQKVSRFRPHIQKTGGFFIAKIRKNGSLQKSTETNKLLPQNPFKIDLSKKIQMNMKDFLQNLFGIKIDTDEFLFLATTNQIYITSHKFKDIKNRLNFEKIGTPIAKTGRNGDIRPTHHLGTILGGRAEFNYVELDFETSQKYAFGEDLSLEEIKEGKFHEQDKYLIIRYQGCGIGIGKIINGYIKNKYKH